MFEITRETAALVEDKLFMSDEGSYEVSVLESQQVQRSVSWRKGMLAILAHWL